MARRKKQIRRRKQGIALLNILESYAYATILTSAVMGTTPWGFVTGGADIAKVSIDPGLARGLR